MKTFEEKEVRLTEVLIDDYDDAMLYINDKFVANASSNLLFSIFSYEFMHSIIVDEVRTYEGEGIVIYAHYE